MRAGQEEPVLHFCTYFDINYLNMGLALFNSLRAHLSQFTLHVLCLDSETYSLLESLNLPQLNPVNLEELESSDQELAACKPLRSRVEFIFTCTPCFPRFLLQRYSQIEMITYLDSDLFFFASPQIIFDEIAGASIAIVPHRFPPAIRGDFIKFGEFNVAWVSFRRTEQGLKALEHWRARCLEWCKDEVQAERYADQKYLEEFPKLFPATHIINHPGANVARWNIQSLRREQNGAALLVEGKPLVFYHFEGLRELFFWVFSLGFDIYRSKPDKTTRELIYKPYLKALREARAMRPKRSVRLVPQRRTDFETRSNSLFYKQSVRLLLTLRSLLAGQAVVFCN